MPKVIGVHTHGSNCKYVLDGISIRVQGLWPNFNQIKAIPHGHKTQQITIQTSLFTHNILAF